MNTQKRTALDKALVNFIDTVTSVAQKSGRNLQESLQNALIYYGIDDDEALNSSLLLLDIYEHVKQDAISA
jgi:hypothetical protein